VNEITLCAPDDSKSCFACCPPIRPKGYEHIQYRNIMKRILRENTEAFDPESQRVVPITGYSCWALGYLDPQHKRIGCLLHPYQNEGNDLRYRVDYGEKCRRETCPEALAFATLSFGAQRFLLEFAEGMDSFEYSSKKRNPVFRLVLWGKDVLEHLVASSISQGINSKTFFKIYPVLRQVPDPRPCAYLLKVLIEKLGPDRIRGEQFATLFEGFCKRLFLELPAVSFNQEDHFTHKLGIESYIQDTIRLGLNIKRITLESALELKEEIDHRLNNFALKMVKSRS